MNELHPLVESAEPKGRRKEIVPSWWKGSEVKDCVTKVSLKQRLRQHNKTSFMAAIDIKEDRQILRMNMSEES